MVNNGNFNQHHGGIVLQDLATRVVVTGKVVVEAEVAAVEVEVEAADVVVEEVALASQVPLMIKARRSRGNEKRPTRVRVPTIIVRFNEGRRWLELGSQLAEGIVSIHRSMVNRYGTCLPAHRVLKYPTIVRS